jgi:hypothetical protein
MLFKISSSPQFAIYYQIQHHHHHVLIYHFESRVVVPAFCRVVDVGGVLVPGHGGLEPIRRTALAQALANSSPQMQPVVNCFDTSYPDMAARKDSTWRHCASFICWAAAT